MLRLHALGLLEFDELCALEGMVEDSLDAADSTANGADDRAGLRGRHACDHGRASIAHPAEQIRVILRT